MTYALVLNDSIQSVGRLPRAARRIDTGQWVMPPDGEWTDVQAATCGYLPVQRTPRPDDTDTTTYEQGVQLVDGQPVEVWTSRQWTEQELEDAGKRANDVTISSKLVSDLEAMQAVLDRANAELRDDPSREIKDTAKAVRRLIRKVEHILDGTE